MKMGKKVRDLKHPLVIYCKGCDDDEGAIPSLDFFAPAIMSAPRGSH